MIIFFISFSSPQYLASAIKHSLRYNHIPVKSQRAQNESGLFAPAGIANMVSMRKFSSGLENVPPRTWAALFAAAVAAKSFYIKDYYPLTSTLNSFSDAGWRLIYGFGDFLVSYMMPFLTVISAAASEHRILAFFIAALSYFTLAFFALTWAGSAATPPRAFWLPPRFFSRI